MAWKCFWQFFAYLAVVYSRPCIRFFGVKIVLNESVKINNQNTYVILKESEYYLKEIGNSPIVVLYEQNTYKTRVNTLKWVVKSVINI